MNIHYPAMLFITASLLVVSGCTDRDRAEAKKTGDGSETFVYAKPDMKKYAHKDEGAKHDVNSEDTATSPSKDAKK